MSLIFATQLTAVATVALAALALATAVLALLAWRKQSREVSDQAEMLKLQQETSEKQAGVLELQAATAASRWKNAAAKDSGESANRRYSYF